VNKSIKARIERPAFLVIELDQQLKLKIVAFLLRCFLRHSLSRTFRTFILFFASLLTLNRCLGFLSGARLRWLSIFFVEKVRLRRYTSLFEDLPQCHFVIKLQRASFALHSITVDACDLI